MWSRDGRILLSDHAIGLAEPCADVALCGHVEPEEADPTVGIDDVHISAGAAGRERYSRSQNGEPSHDLTIGVHCPAAEHGEAAMISS
jgi:hypothetical protein